ncbi:hypothetical protein TNCV_2543031 [Trichonephila clavipes]|nr:hypothetical protein TNCV_2543031 [Trichonephila clavipes]
MNHGGGSVLAWGCKSASELDNLVVFDGEASFQEIPDMKKLLEKNVTKMYTFSLILEEIERDLNNYEL